MSLFFLSLSVVVVVVVKKDDVVVVWCVVVVAAGGGVWCVWCVVVNLSIDKEEEESKFTTLPFFLQVK
jgi:hypothetical protein